MQKENANVVNDNTGQATPDRENTAWKNETRLVTRQAKPDLHITTARGFTLIELLVVVLIIGILAAVAVPQYQKAVEKSKATTVLSLLKAVGDAQQMYHVATGNYALSFDELTVDVPWSGSEEGVTHFSVRDTRSNGEWSIQLTSAGNGTAGIVIVSRLTGKYAGAGFIYFVAGDTYFADGSIVCKEQKDIGLIFSETKGNFCKKVMRSTSVANSASSYYDAWAL